MMYLLSWIKVFFICVADTINQIFDPFEYHVYRNVGAALHLREITFYADLMHNFVKDGQFSYQVPMPEDHGDAAIFQGIYTGMMNMKFETNTTEVRQANEALGKFFVNGILIRGIREDGTVNDTTSNDSATGALFGLYNIWLHSTGEADSAIRKWADRIIDSGYALTDLNLKPTKFGQLESGWKSDPLRLTLLLAILKLAHRTTHESDDVYEQHYRKLFKVYHPLLRYARVKLLWWDKDCDIHRAAIHTRILYDLTGNKIYIDGLERLARIGRKENNAWVNILCFADNLSMLTTFTLTHKLTGNMPVPDYVERETVKWGKDIRNKKAAPMYVRGSQEFTWSRNMFSRNEWVGNTEASWRHSGLDFLVAYWQAVRQGSLV